MLVRQDLLVHCGIPLCVYLGLAAVSIVCQMPCFRENKAAVSLKTFSSSLGIILIFLFFPGASQKTFSFFNCDRFDTGQASDRTGPHRMAAYHGTPNAAIWHERVGGCFSCFSCSPRANAWVRT